MLSLALLSAIAAAQTGSPPASETSRFDGQRIGYTVTQTPGTGRAGETLELAIRLEELVRTPDPVFGRRRLLAGAEVDVYLLDPQGAVVDARVGVREGDDGNFVVHFTPVTDGIYSAVLHGSAPGGIVIDYAVLVSVNVWPMLTGLSPDPLPSKRMAPVSGDARHGKTLCVRDCIRPPQRMSSEAAEALRDEKLLDEVAPFTREIRAVDRLDVLAYVRSQFIRVRDLFPAMKSFTVQAAKLDTDALNRLRSRNAPLTNGFVFIVSGTERLGYVVFSSDGVRETGVALNRSLNVVSARVRESDGTMRATQLSNEAPAARHALELVNTVLIREREAASIEADLK